MWLLWREKSSPTFENEEVLEVNLKLSFLRLRCGWSTVLGLLHDRSSLTAVLIRSLLLVILWLQFFRLSCVLY